MRRKFGSPIPQKRSALPHPSMPGVLLALVREGLGKIRVMDRFGKIRTVQATLRIEARKTPLAGSYSSEIRDGKLVVFYDHEDGRGKRPMLVEV